MVREAGRSGEGGRGGEIELARRRAGDSPGRLREQPLDLVSGVQLGCCWRRSAAAPATCGAENDVPLISAYPGSIKFWSGASWASVVPAGRVEAMWRPGASSSGFEKPSRVTPLDVKLATVSSVVVAVSFESVDPTVITKGSLPGA